MRPKAPPHRAPLRVIDDLHAALNAALLKNCAVPEAHQQAMRLYLNTWVVPGISAALRWAEGAPRREED